VSTGCCSCTLDALVVVSEIAWISSHTHEVTLLLAAQALSVFLPSELSHTGNPSTSSAQTSDQPWASLCRYIDYILETVAKRELFQWLSLSSTKFWHALLFRDRCVVLVIVGGVLQSHFWVIAPPSCALQQCWLKLTFVREFCIAWQGYLHHASLWHALAQGLTSAIAATSGTTTLGCWPACLRSW